MNSRVVVVVHVASLGFMMGAGMGSLVVDVVMVDFVRGPGMPSLVPALPAYAVKSGDLEVVDTFLWTVLCAVDAQATLQRLLAHRGSASSTLLLFRFLHLRLHLLLLLPSGCYLCCQAGTGTGTPSSPPPPPPPPPVVKVAVHELFRITPIES